MNDLVGFKNNAGLSSSDQRRRSSFPKFRRASSLIRCSSVGSSLVTGEDWHVEFRVVLEEVEVERSAAKIAVKRDNQSDGLIMVVLPFVDVSY